MRVPRTARSVPRRGARPAGAALQALVSSTRGTGAREVGPSDHLDRVDACCDVADRVEVGVPAWSSEKERCRSIGCCSFGVGDTEALEVLGSRQQCKVSERR